MTARDDHKQDRELLSFERSWRDDDLGARIADGYARLRAGGGRRPCGGRVGPRPSLERLDEDVTQWGA